MDAAVKMLQTVRFVMLGSIVLYGVMADRFAPAPSGQANPLLFEIITFLAVLLVGTIVILRRVMVTRAEALLGNDPNDPAALARWRAGYIVIYALAEAIALYGFVLRYMRFTTSQVLPFFLAGFVLMLFYGPRRPANAIG